MSAQILQIKPITARVIRPFVGPALDQYVDLMIEAERLADEIYVLTRKLALANIRAASNALKIELMERAR